MKREREIDRERERERERDEMSENVSQTFFLFLKLKRNIFFDSLFLDLVIKIVPQTDL